MSVTTESVEAAGALAFPQPNYFAYLRSLSKNYIGIYPSVGTPTDGVNGFGAGKLGPGCLVIDISNQILYINTNTLLSPTWTGVGSGAGASLTNGNILVGSAGGVATAVPVSGDATLVNTGALTLAATTIKTAMLVLTNAQIKALRATPITVVAAPGAGKYILPISASIEMIYGGTNAFTSAANDVLGLKWKDGTTSTLLTGAVQALVQATASAMGIFLPLTASNVAKANVDNQALVVHNITASEVAGNAAADNTMNLVVKYSVHLTV